MERLSVQITRHFAHNLAAIEEFLREADATTTFASLLDDILDRLLPTLEGFPELGQDFLIRQPSCREGMVMAAALNARLGARTTLRERVRGDYLILYARRGHNIYLLAIKHHRQLSFDFYEHWQG